MYKHTYVYIQGASKYDEYPCNINVYVYAF